MQLGLTVIFPVPLPLRKSCPDGGIGRRAGLKHQCRKACRFDPGSGYLFYSPLPSPTWGKSCSVRTITLACASLFSARRLCALFSSPSRPPHGGSRATCALSHLPALRCSPHGACAPCFLPPPVPHMGEVVLRARYHTCLRFAVLRTALVRLVFFPLPSPTWGKSCYVRAITLACASLFSARRLCALFSSPSRPPHGGSRATCALSHLPALRCSPHGACAPCFLPPPVPHMGEVVLRAPWGIEKLPES